VIKLLLKLIFKLTVIILLAVKGMKIVLLKFRYNGFCFEPLI